MIKTLLKAIIPTPIKNRIHLNLKKIKYHNTLKKTHSHYRDVVQKIKTRPENQKIRFGMYVVFDSSFGGYELIEILRKKSNKSSLKIVIVPDVSRGEHHQKLIYEQTKSFFVKKYGAEYVLDGLINGNYIDYADKFDIIYCANPYDSMVPEVFRVQYLSRKDVLPLYISYGYNISKKHAITAIENNFFWKVIANSKDDLAMYKKYGLINGKNVTTLGYAKMDSLKSFVEKPRDKKRIIIASHHTVAMDSLPLSNFLIYSDFFLILPNLYPEFDFVFRPHPLLWTALINANLWTQDEVDDYLKKMENVGIEYSKGGDYFDLFVNSDAMIHDCGSFLVEYLYLKKPCCYMLRSPKVKKIFPKYVQKCLNSYQIAYQEKDIINFLDDIKAGKNFVASEKQQKFVDEKIMINFPNVSKAIFDYICKELNV